MFNHKDTLMTSSFQYQLVGRKKWHLCSPANDAVFEAKGKASYTFMVALP